MTFTAVEGKKGYNKSGYHNFYPVQLRSNFMSEDLLFEFGVGRRESQWVWLRSFEDSSLLSVERLFSHAFNLLLTNIKYEVSETFTVE